MKKTSKVYVAVLVLVALLPAVFLHFTTYYKNTPTMRFVKAMTAAQNGTDLYPEYFGGYDKNKAESQTEAVQYLTATFGVEDRETLLTTIDNIKSMVYTQAFLESLEAYHQDSEEWQEYAAYLKSADESIYDALMNIYASYEKSFDSEQGISAFELSLAANVASTGYLAGYLSFDEAASICFDMAQQLQDKFDSWESYQKNYILANNYVYLGTQNTVAQQSNFFKKLFAQVDKELGLYSVPFQTKLSLGDLKESEASVSGKYEPVWKQLLFGAGVTAASGIVVLLLAFYVIYPLCSRGKKKKMAASDFGATHMFTSNNARLWINVPEGKMAIVTRGNPFRLQLLSAAKVDSAAISDGGMDESGVTKRIAISTIIDGVRFRIPTLVSRTPLSIKSNLVESALKKADTYVKAILQAKANAEATEQGGVEPAEEPAQMEETVLPEVETAVPEETVEETREESVEEVPEEEAPTQEKVEPLPEDVLKQIDLAITGKEEPDEDEEEEDRS